MSICVLAERYGVKGQTLRKHCLVSLGTSAEAVIARTDDAASRAIAHLLDDLADALGVYDRLTRQSSDTPGTPVTLQRVPSDVRAWPSRVSPCDALVLGLRVDNGPNAATDAFVREALSNLLGACDPGTRLYTLACSVPSNPASAHEQLSRIAHACEASPCTWSGGLALGGAPAIAAQARAPRMGVLRRARSEAIDRLIMAIRCGMSLDTAGPGHILPVRPTCTARVLTFLQQRA